MKATIQKYLKKYTSIFEHIEEKPKGTVEALELIVRHGYMGEVHKLSQNIKKGIYPLPELKGIYEKYPEFAHYHDKSAYIEKANLLVWGISEKIKRFNEDKKEHFLNSINHFLASLIEHIDSYESKDSHKDSHKDK